MTPAEVKARVEEIDKIKGDFEAAHSKEDQLHQDVLRWVAEYGSEPAASLAHEALKTTEIDFARYCA